MDPVEPLRASFENALKTTFASTPSHSSLARDRFWLYRVI
jgi:hypothetical protein